MKFVKRFLLVLPLLLAPLAGQPAEPPKEPVSVSVLLNGDTLLITAEFRVPVSSRAAWEVLTDFDHMTEFLPHLKESQVLGQSGNHLKVQQKGEMKFGPLPFEYESLRDVELRPYEMIRSKSLKGTLRSQEGVTYLAPEGRGTTRVFYSVTAVADSYLAALMPTGLMRDELKVQFLRMREEMLRRDQLQLGKVRRPSTKG